MPLQYIEKGFLYLEMPWSRRRKCNLGDGVESADRTLTAPPVFHLVDLRLGLIFSAQHLPTPHCV